MVDDRLYPLISASSRIPSIASRRADKATSRVALGKLTHQFNQAIIAVASRAELARIPSYQLQSDPER